MRIFKKENNNTKYLAYKSLVGPVLEYGTACWVLYKEGQISAFHRVQRKRLNFVHHTSNSSWENFASRRTFSCLCALLKRHFGEWVWKAIGDRLQWPHYLTRVDHERKIRCSRQRTHIEKYSFAGRTIQHWN